jgi:hypothetical protein
LSIFRKGQEKQKDAGGISKALSAFASNPFSNAYACLGLGCIRFWGQVFSPDAKASVGAKKAR